MHVVQNGFLLEVILLQTDSARVSEKLFKVSLVKEL